MKANGTFIISAAMAFIWLMPVQAQDEDRKVQIRIIENGKVTTDTTFSVNEPVDKNDVNHISRLLNKDDVFIFNRKPGKNSHVYSYRFRHMPFGEMDSLFLGDSMFLRQDSIFKIMSKRFNGDSAFMFDAMADRRIIMRHGPGNFRHGMGDRPHHKRMRQHVPGAFEKEIIIEEDGLEMNDNEESDVIIHRKGPGRKDVIIKKDESGQVKTIRKRIDDDTEIIIIKKGKKNKT